MEKVADENKEQEPTEESGPTKDDTAEGEPPAEITTLDEKPDEGASLIPQEIPSATGKHYLLLPILVISGILVVHIMMQIKTSIKFIRFIVFFSSEICTATWCSSSNDEMCTQPDAAGAQGAFCSGIKDSSRSYLTPT